MTSAAYSFRIILNGERVELPDFDPHTTLLQFLREQRRLTGTKEGCAEGDCGACTVVMGELEQDGQGRYRVALTPINACIRLLATLDGRALFTVESLKAANGALHPVQEAMVQCHGSQCGFCTPGFVMALFALFKSQAQPTREQTQTALSGNLCRCTGYRPILDAAQVMYGAKARQDGCSAGGCSSSAEQWRFSPATQGGEVLLPGEAELVTQLLGLKRQLPLEIKTPQGRYTAPLTVTQLSAAVAQNPDAWIVAGATDIGLWITKALQTSAHLIYTGDVDALKTVHEDETGLQIGASVTLEQAFRAINRFYPELAHLWTRFASWPIRCSGTLGGNVANGSPIGDSMPALIALNAKVVLRKGDTQRTLPLEALYLDYKKQDRAPGEWVEAVIVPRRHLAADERLYVASYKISKRNEQDISAVCAAFAVTVARDTVTQCRIAMGGMAATSRRAPQTEKALLGRSWSEHNVRAAMDAMAQDFQPLTDMRASAAYRLQVAQNLLHRFWLESSGETSVRLY